MLSAANTFSASTYTTNLFLCLIEYVPEYLNNFPLQKLDLRGNSWNCPIFDYSEIMVNDYSETSCIGNNKTFFIILTMFWVKTHKKEELYFEIKKIDCVGNW